MKPSDLVPRFGPENVAAKRAALRAWFQSLTPERFGKAGRNVGN